MRKFEFFFVCCLLLIVFSSFSVSYAHEKPPPPSPPFDPHNCSCINQNGQVSSSSKVSSDSSASSSQQSSSTSNGQQNQNSNQNKQTSSSSQQTSSSESSKSAASQGNSASATGQQNSASSQTNQNASQQGQSQSSSSQATDQNVSSSGQQSSTSSTGQSTKKNQNNSGSSQENSQSTSASNQQTQAGASGQSSTSSSQQVQGSTSGQNSASSQSSTSSGQQAQGSASSQSSTSSSQQAQGSASDQSNTSSNQQAQDSTSGQSSISSSQQSQNSASGQSDASSQNNASSSQQAQSSASGQSSTSSNQQAQGTASSQNTASSSQQAQSSASSQSSTSSGQQTQTTSSNQASFSSSSNVNFKGQFTKIYAFGDSFTDTGNAATMEGVKPFVGKMFPNFGQLGIKAGNRMSNGRLLIDFLCEDLGLPSIKAYKNASADFSSGVNFAIAGSTCLSMDLFAAHKITLSLMFKQKPESSLTQIDWFNKFILNTDCKGMDEAKCKAHLSNSLFWVGALGLSDYGRIFGSAISGKSLTEASVDHVTKILKALLDKGARYVVVQGLPPAGCCPLQLFLNPPRDRDNMGCSSALNALIQAHNDFLQKKLGEIRAQYKDAVIIYADTYNAYKTILINYKKFQIEEPFKACCGAGGGLLNFDLHSLCGSTGTTACSNPQSYISWDGIHFTEAMHKHLAELFFHQGFCSPSFDALIQTKIKNGPAV